MPGADALALDTADAVFGAVSAAVVAKAVGVRRETLASWRRRGKGPPSMRIGRLLTLYPIEDLRRWWGSPAAAYLRRRQRQPRDPQSTRPPRRTAPRS